MASAKIKCRNIWETLLKIKQFFCSKSAQHRLNEKKYTFLLQVWNKFEHTATSQPCNLLWKWQFAKHFHIDYDLTWPSHEPCIVEKMYYCPHFSHEKSKKMSLTHSQTAGIRAPVTAFHRENGLLSTGQYSLPYKHLWFTLKHQTTSLWVSFSGHSTVTKYSIVLLKGKMFKVNLNPLLFSLYLLSSGNLSHNTVIIVTSTQMTPKSVSLGHTSTLAPERYKTAYLTSLGCLSMFSFDVPPLKYLSRNLWVLTFLSPSPYPHCYIQSNTKSFHFYLPHSSRAVHFSPSP